MSDRVNSTIRRSPQNPEPSFTLADSVFAAASRTGDDEVQSLAKAAQRLEALTRRQTARRNMNGKIEMPEGVLLVSAFADSQGKLTVTAYLEVDEASENSGLRQSGRTQLRTAHADFLRMSEHDEPVYRITAEVRQSVRLGPFRRQEDWRFVHYEIVLKKSGWENVQKKPPVKSAAPIPKPISNAQAAPVLAHEAKAEPVQLPVADKPTIPGFKGIIVEEVAPGIVFTVDLITSTPHKKTDWSKVEVLVHAFGRQLPAQLRRRQGDHPYLEVSFALQDGGTKEDFTFRINKIEKDENGAFVLEERRVDELRLKISELRQKESGRVIALVNEASQEAEAVGEMITQTLRILEELILEMDMPEEIAAIRNNVFALEAEIVEAFADLKRRVDDFIMARENVLSAWNNRADRIQNSQDQMRATEKLVADEEMKLSLLRAKADRLWAVYDAASEKNPHYHRYMQDYEAAEIAHDNFAAGLAVRRLEWNLLLAEQTAAHASVTNDPVHPEIEREASAHMAIDSGMLNYNRLLAKIEEKLVSLRRSASRAISRNGRGEVRDITKTERSTNGLALAAILNPATSFLVTAASVQGSTRTSRLSARHFVGGITTDMRDLADDPLLSPAGSALFKQSRSGESLLFEYHVVPPDAATYQDIEITRINREGKELEKNWMQGIQSSAGPSKDMIYIIPPPQLDTDSVNRDALKAAYFNRRVYVMWVDGNGVPRINEARFKDLPNEIQAQAYLTTYPVTKSGSNYEAGLSSDASPRPGSTGKLVFSPATSSAGPTPAKYVSPQGTENIVFSFRHEGTCPVDYYGVILGDVEPIPEIGSVEYENYLSENVRWFVRRVHAGKDVLAELIWEGLPHFVRTNFVNDARISNPLVNDDKSEIVNGTQRIASFRSPTEPTQRLVINCRNNRVQRTLSTALSSISGYGASPPVVIETCFTWQGREIAARVYSTNGAAWSEGGGYMVIMPNDPAIDFALLEFNASGGTRNLLCFVPKRCLPGAYRGVQLRSLFHEAESALEDLDAGGIRLRKKFSAIDSAHSRESIILVATSSGRPERLGCFKYEAKYVDADGKENDLITFIQHLVGCDNLFFATPDGQKLFRLDYELGRDTIAGFDQGSALSEDVRKLWRRNIMRADAARLASQGRLAGGVRAILEPPIVPQQVPLFPDHVGSVPALAGPEISDDTFVGVGETPELPGGPGVENLIDPHVAAMSSAMVGPGAFSPVAKLR